MKRTADNYRTRKARKQSIPAHRRHPRGVPVMHRNTGRASHALHLPPAPVSITQYLTAALAPLLLPFRRGNR